jgi:hypothetical protein
MGSNSSKVAFTQSFDNHSNYINSTLYLNNDLLLSESEIQDYVQKVILNDEILSGFVRLHLGTLKKTRSKHHRPGNEKLWNTCWGETMSQIEDELLESDGFESKQYESSKVVSSSISSSLFHV